MNLLGHLRGQRAETVQKPRVKIRNVTRKSVLAESVEIADSGAARSKGLLGRDGLAAGEGLWIVPCEAVHTVGMRFPIDLVFINRNNVVKKVRSSVGAWRVAGCLTAHSVIELAAGSVGASETRRGDTLEFSPVEGPEPVSETV